MNDVIQVEEALALIKSGDAVLVDVREADEFKAEHIAYAMSVPLGSIEEGISLLDIPKDKIILFQCLKGARGQMACDRIKGMNKCPNKIANIEGGIEAWKNKNLPVIGAGTSSSTISIFRQVQIIVGFLIALFVALGFSGMTSMFALAGFIGVFFGIAGVTGWCGLAMILSKMPWNK